jgi:hypothetical protein
MQQNKFGKILVSLLIGLTLLMPLLIFSSCGGPGGNPFNQSPEIISLTAASEQLNPSASTNITCEASDADRDTLTYAWTASGGTVNGSGSEVSWTAPAQGGDYTVKVVVSDGKGAEANKSVSINVIAGESSPPFIKKVTYEPNRYEIYDDEKITFTCTASDPDGDAITYHWEVDAGTIAPQGDGHTAVWTTPIELNEKEHMMTVYVTDPSGNRSTKQFVTVKILCDCYREGKPIK